MLTDNAVRQLARPADIRLGHEIVKNGLVAFTVFQPGKALEATVTQPGHITRRTKFALQNGQLAWRCTCTSDTKHFCKHLVATALAAQAKGTGGIYKAAGIIIKNRKLLHERSVGKPVFIAPGGRIEPGETPETALIRELKEELNIDVMAADLKPFGVFTAEAANHPGQQVHMHVFVVVTWQGEITPGAEVAELLWLGHELPHGKEIGSISAHELLPRLHVADLVD